MAKFYEEPKVLDTLVSFDQDADGKKLIIKQEQQISDTFLDGLAEQRLASTNLRANDFYKVADIPIAVVYELKNKYNFDIFKEPVRATLAMLKKLDLDKFIATQKRI